jgi:hypothetical protein
MPEFPTIVRRRLQAGEDRKGFHPDADTLTAYVEQLLPGHERDYVTRHLSVCSECRDVVTLTMPEVTAAAEMPEAVVSAVPTESVSVMPTMPRRRWFLTPAFGMAASIAAMALGLTFVLRLDHERAPTASNQQPRQEIQARNENPARNESKVAGNNQSVANPAVQPAPAPRITAGLATAQVAQQRNSAGKPKSVPADSIRAPQPASQPADVADLRRDYLNSQLLFSSSATARSPDLPQAPQPMFPRALNLHAPALVGGSAGAGQTNAYLQVPAAGQPQAAGEFYPRPGTPSSSVIDKLLDASKLPLHAKKLAPAIRAKETEHLSMFSPGLSLADSSQAATAKGADVSEAKGELAQSQAFTRRALTPAAVARLDEPVIQWKVAQGKLLKSSDLSSWVEAYPASEGIVFTVVSGSGPDIWAGGSKAALVHSRDAGATWDKVRLGVAASGDIMAIEGGGLTLQVKTSTGQTWVTSDGGSSWNQR